MHIQTKFLRLSSVGEDREALDRLACLRIKSRPQSRTSRRASGTLRFVQHKAVHFIVALVAQAVLIVA